MKARHMRILAGLGMALAFVLGAAGDGGYGIGAGYVNSVTNDVAAIVATCQETNASQQAEIDNWAIATNIAQQVEVDGILATNLSQQAEIDGQTNALADQVTLIEGTNVAQQAEIDLILSTNVAQQAEIDSQIASNGLFVARDGSTAITGDQTFNGTTVFFQDQGGMGADDYWTNGLAADGDNAALVWHAQCTDGAVDVARWYWHSVAFSVPIAGDGNGITNLPHSISFNLADYTNSGSARIAAAGIVGGNGMVLKNLHYDLGGGTGVVMVGAMATNASMYTSAMAITNIASLVLDTPGVGDVTAFADPLIPVGYKPVILVLTNDYEALTDSGLNIVIDASE